MATTVPQVAATQVRQNYLAILVAAIANFLFEAVWYSFFLKSWENGIGRTHEWLRDNSPNPGFQYAAAIVSAAVMAGAISWVTQKTGRQTWWRGIQVGAILWFGLELTSLSTEYVFEVRPWSLLGINAGFWLIGMMLMGAVVGGWKRK